MRATARPAALVDGIADGIILEEEARRALRAGREEIEAVQKDLVSREGPARQLPTLVKFTGINIAEYSLAEKRALLQIVVKDIRLRFDRLFIITYNLYEAPGRLFVGRVNIERKAAHNSKLRQ